MQGPESTFFVVRLMAQVPNCSPTNRERELALDCRETRTFDAYKKIYELIAVTQQFPGPKQDAIEVSIITGSPLH